ncbi:MAG: beta-class carbonic anhydrase [Terriglobales bacterium]
MSATDEAVRANEAFARQFAGGHLASAPARKLAVVACMDARLNVEQALGLGIGDAHVIRNAGGVVTVDTLASLLVSHHLLGTREFVIINHTDCGMLTFTDAELRQRLERSSGVVVAAPSCFYAFTDLEANLRRQVQVVRSHPWVPREVGVRGFLYDVKTGRLRELA